MNVSRYVSAPETQGDTRLIVDLLPDMTDVQLNSFLQTEGKLTVSRRLSTIVPRRLAACILERADLHSDTPIAELPKKARLAMIEDMKRLEIPLNGTRGYTKAEVTAGGVKLKEVNPQTMESRLAPGLFLAGEILDVDGPIGGFNFQAAFSTGHLAGQ